MRQAVDVWAGPVSESSCSCAAHNWSEIEASDLSAAHNWSEIEEVTDLSAAQRAPC